MSAGNPTVEDLRENIHERLEPGAAKLVVRWSDGRTDEFDVVDTRRGADGQLIARTARGEQVEVGRALEWLLVGRIGREEL